MELLSLTGVCGRKNATKSEYFRQELRIWNGIFNNFIDPITVRQQLAE